MKKGVLSVLSALTGTIVGAVVGAGATVKIVGGADNKTKELAEKHFALFLLMNQWVKVKQEGKTLSSYFEKNGYKKIAVYGMSYVGETLLSELKEKGIEVAYGIDRNADIIYADIDVITVDELSDDVDAIVVTAVTYFDEIEEMLSEKVSCPIISLEDIIYEV